ncbi:hypothetical protein ACUY3H_07035 [Corynebacterium ureicelerivorans]|uniref:hypothetical protein n=1 Tax=uncultured Corynebacterium sp. TaxID=159447 RepID=UPI00259B72AC|nr:hypothetical protein [uncultured Corynebacterium sp.]
MAKQEIFVHPDCPDCADVIADYNDNPNNFEDAELYDVAELGSLKRFLHYRDRLSGYAATRDAGKVGVPSKVIDGTAVEYFDAV